MIRIVCIVIGYVFGLFQTAYIYGKMKGIDIRKVGSGNAGTTNALRAFGTGVGVLVFAGDCLKCLLAVVIVRNTIGRAYPDIRFLLGVYAALGCILGHNFPFYMNFKGGKGIAATLGMSLSYCFLVKYGILVPVIGFGMFLVIFFLTNYVSLGSIVGYIMLFIAIVIFGERGAYGFPEASNRAMLTEYYIVFGILTVMAVYRHKENIKRLIAGNERKTYLKGKPEIDVNREADTDKC